jgi:hypothetical protein
MALTAANPGGWSLNEVLTSAQMTHLQNELLKAIDGVNGGTYTLASPLTFQGSDVRIAADLEVISGGEINIQSGGALNVLAGGILDFSGDLHISSGGELIVESGGLVTFENGSDMFVDGTAVIDLEGSLAVNSGGSIDVTSGGDINVTSADVTINGGGQILLNGGGLLIGATGFIQANGGDITLGSGSFLNAGAGAGVNVEDAEDITINDSPEGFRTTLVPLGNVGGSWVPRMTSELVWEQVAAGLDRIAFPLAIRPGDDLIDVFVSLNGENGHAALPATMPEVRLVRAALDGTLTTLAVKVDPSASTGVYEAPHYVVLQTGSLDSGAMPRLATDEPLYIVVTGEAGADAIGGLEIGSITGNITARSYRGDLAIYS